MDEQEKMPRFSFEYEIIETKKLPNGTWYAAIRVGDRECESYASTKVDAVRRACLVYVWL